MYKFTIDKHLKVKKKNPRWITNIQILVLGERRDAVWGPGDQKDGDSGREAHLTVQTSWGLYMFIIERETLGVPLNALKWGWNVDLALVEFISVFIYLCKTKHM